MPQQNINNLSNYLNTDSGKNVKEVFQNDLVGVLQDHEDSINTIESDLNTSNTGIKARVTNLESQIADENLVKIYNTVAEMQTDSANITVGMTIQLLGYYTKNDGAGHYRKTESSDDGSGIEVGGLWANLINKDINILCFGLKFLEVGNKIDQSTLLNKTFTWCRNNKVRELKCIVDLKNQYGEGEIYASSIIYFHDVFLIGEGKIISPVIENKYLNIFKEVGTFTGNLTFPFNSKNYLKFQKAIALKNCTVLLIGDSLTMSGNQLDQSRYSWVDILEKKLKETYPDVNFIFKHRAIAGTYLSHIFGGLSWHPVPASEINKANGEDWLTNKELTWISYLTPLNADLTISAFGMNQEAYVENYTELMQNVKTAVDSDFVWITTPNRTISHAIQGGDYTTSPYWNNINSCAEQTRNFCKRNGDICIDVNRWDKIISLGIDEENTTFKGYYNVPNGAVGIFRDVIVSNGTLNVGTFTSTGISNPTQESEFASIKTKKYLDDVSFGFTIKNLTGALKITARRGNSTEGIQIQIESNIMYLIARDISEADNTKIIYENFAVNDYVNIVIAKNEIKVYKNKYLVGSKKCGDNSYVYNSFLYLTKNGDSIENLQINEGDYDRFIPVITDRQKFNVLSGLSLGDDLGTGANGINHPTSIAERLIYSKPIEETFNYIKHYMTDNVLISSTLYDSSSPYFKGNPATDSSEVVVYEYVKDIIMWIKFKNASTGQATLFSLPYKIKNQMTSFAQSPVDASQNTIFRVVPSENGLESEISPYYTFSGQFAPVEGFIKIEKQD